MPQAMVADVDTMSPQLWFVHADHLERPVQMTDGAQAVVWDAVYRPFGQPVSITGSASNNLRFRGQYFLRPGRTTTVTGNSGTVSCDRSALRRFRVFTAANPVLNRPRAVP
jgi:hypothetical protein